MKYCEYRSSAFFVILLGFSVVFQYRSLENIVLVTMVILSITLKKPLELETSEQQIWYICRKNGENFLSRLSLSILGGVQIFFSLMCGIIIIIMFKHEIQL